MKLTYKELQSNLKDLRDSGIAIKCKLSSSKVALEACYLNLIREGLVNDLRGVDLSDAYLGDADLRNSDLTKANLEKAYLNGAKLSGISLRGVNLKNAKLASADLSGSDLRSSDSSGADLCGADLTGAIGYRPVTQEAISLILKVAKIVTTDTDKLEMAKVHTCDSVHCAGGWICVLDAEAAKLEEELGWNVAACTVCPVPEFTRLFYETNEEMLEFLTKSLEDNGQSLREKYLV